MDKSSLLYLVFGFLSGVGLMMVHNKFNQTSVYSPSHVGEVHRKLDTILQHIQDEPEDQRNRSGQQLRKLTRPVSGESSPGPSSAYTAGFMNRSRTMSDIVAPDLSSDYSLHRENRAVADSLHRKVKVLVWVMTQPQNLYTKAVHVNMTWGKRANKLLYASDVYDSKFPTIPIEIKHGRKHLTEKTMAAFKYVHDNYVDSFDWFMKTDDDTYVVMENLRYFLSDKNPEEPVYFGHLFNTLVKQGYYSGGGGYVLSREALRRFGKKQHEVCQKDYGAEDVTFGHCMENLGVKTQETVDKLGRTRFHCFNLETHLRGGYPDWYYSYDQFKGTKKGIDSISDYAITFHYVDIATMYDLEFFIYHLRPYGINNGLMELNSATH